MRNCVIPALDFLTESEHLSFAAKTDIKAMASLTSLGRGRRSEIRNIELRSNMEIISFFTTYQKISHSLPTEKHQQKYIRRATPPPGEKEKFGLTLSTCHDSTTGF